MATFYLDPENGNDSNDGTTFANRWKTMNSGATAARIAPGDTIRLISAPEPTSIGTAQWTKSVGDAFLAATSAISAVSNATPIVITTSTSHGLSNGDVVRITGQTGNYYINGLWEVQNVNAGAKTFELKGSYAAGAGGTATGTVRKYNERVLKLSTAVNKSIDMCEVAWTAATNITATRSTSGVFKQGDACAYITVGGSFTTGKMAYRTLPATLDLSAYEQITLWIDATAALTANDYSIRLCSDTTGDVSVDTLSIPAVAAHAYRQLMPITINKGSALGNSIASIAIYRDSGSGTPSIRLDCITAVKAASNDASLGLQSLISKNTASYSSTETWYPIAAIEETVIAFDSGPQWSSNASVHYPGWYGTTESVTTYKLEPLKTVPQGTYAGSNGLVVQDSGTAGNQITFSGGWDRTNMSSQTGMTWFDCRNGLGYGFNWNAGSFLTASRIGVVRGVYGFAEIYGNNAVMNDCHANGNWYGIQFNQTYNGSYSNLFICNNSNAGVILGRSNNLMVDVDFGDAFKKINNNGRDQTGAFGAYGLTLASVRTKIGVIGELCNNQHGLYPSPSHDTTIEEISDLSANNYGAFIGGSGAPLLIRKITACSGNQSVFYISSYTGEYTILELTSSGNKYLVNGGGSSQLPACFAYVRRWTSTDSFTAVNNVTNSNGRIQIAVSRWGNTVGDSRIYLSGCDVKSESSVIHAASGYSYRFAPWSTSLVPSTWPAIIPIAYVRCVANQATTISAWVQRSNTGLTVGIMARRNQLTGMSSATDYSASITASANTWEQISISFTPTETGVIELLGFAYGGTTYYGYIDDIQVTRSGGVTENITMDQEYFGLPWMDLPVASGNTITVVNRNTNIFIPEE